MFNLSIVLI